MTFTEKLDMLMEERHLNKNSLSKACGIPYTTIDGWYKKGVSDLKLSTLKKLTSFFGLSLDYWLDDEIEDPQKARIAEEATDDAYSSVSLSDLLLPKEKAPASVEVEADERSSIVAALTNMLQSAGWIREDGDISAEDRRFIRSVAIMLDAYFDEQR